VTHCLTPPDDQPQSLGRKDLKVANGKEYQMTEQHLIPGQGEESLARETAGAPHNPLIQPTGAAGDRARQGDHGQSGGSPKERSPWDKFLAKLRGARLVKSPQKLRDLRDLAKAWYPVLDGERQAIQTELDTATDPLDQAALKEELAAIKAKAGKVDKGLTEIGKRAKSLVEEVEA